MFVNRPEYNTHPPSPDFGLKLVAVAHAQKLRHLHITIDDKGELESHARTGRLRKWHRLKMRTEQLKLWRDSRLLL